MRELSMQEIEQVDGGMAAVFWSLVSSVVYDGLKALGSEPTTGVACGGDACGGGGGGGR